MEETENESDLVEIIDLESDFLDEYVSDETEAQLSKYHEYEDIAADSFFDGLDETKETEYPCPLCKEHFIGKQAIKAHVRRYFKYVCQTCHKRYFRERYLQVHLRNAHLPSKEISCPICQKVFRAVYNLKQHLHLHSDKKTYVCKFEGCDKAFKQKPGLHQHIRLVHNPNDNFCLKCRRRVPDMEKHFNSAHPNCPLPKRKKQIIKIEINEKDDTTQDSYEYDTSNSERFLDETENDQFSDTNNELSTKRKKLQETVKTKKQRTQDFIVIKNEADDISQDNYENGDNDSFSDSFYKEMAKDPFSATWKYENNSDSEDENHEDLEN